MALFTDELGVFSGSIVIYKNNTDFGSGSKLTISPDFTNTGKYDFIYETSGSTSVKLLTLSSSGQDPRIGIGNENPQTTLDIKEVKDDAVGAEILIRSSRTAKGGEVNDGAGKILFTIDSGSYVDVKSSGSIAIITTEIKAIDEKMAGGDLIFKVSDRNLSDPEPATVLTLFRDTSIIGTSNNFITANADFTATGNITGGNIVRGYSLTSDTNILASSGYAYAQTMRIGSNVSAPTKGLYVSGNISSSNDLSIRGFSSVSASLASLASGVGTLQQVTDAGNTTNKAISSSFNGVGFFGTASWAINVVNGGGGGSGGADSAFLTQSTAATTWSFAHNLGTQYPVITVYDTTGLVIIPQEIDGEDTNNLKIYFPTSQSGYATAVGGTSALTYYSQSLTTASVSLNTITFTKGDSSTFNITVNTGSIPTLQQVTTQGANTTVPITASIISASSFTGSLFGTASWAVSASRAITSSHALTASYVNPLLQNVIITGSLLVTQSSISKVDYIDFTTTATPAFQEGRINWIDDTKTLAIDTELSGFQIEVGHQNVVRVRNQSGNTILKGRAVYISGSSGNRPLIYTASFEIDPTSASTVGLVAADIGTNNNGYIISNGLIRDINTTAYTAGQVLYLSSSGQLGTTAPVAPLHGVRMGKVITSATSGIIHVDIDNGYEIGELHDIVDNTTSTTYGSLLVKSGSVWKDGYQLTGSYGLTGSLNATSFTGSLLGTASWANNSITASYILNAISSSFALTSSLANRNLLTASVLSNIITFTKGDGSTFNITVDTGSGGGGGGVTINNNVDNYLITATGTANTLNGEVGLQYSSSILINTGKSQFGGASVLNTTHQFKSSGSDSYAGFLLLDPDGEEAFKVAGSMAASDFMVTIGDVNSAYNATKIEVDDPNSKINLKSKVYGNAYATNATSLGTNGTYDIGSRLATSWAVAGGPTLTAGRIVYLSGSIQWAEARANASGSSYGMLGVVTDAASQNEILIEGTIQISGSALQSGVAGQPVYLSAATAGQVTLTAPTASNNVVRIIGYITKANSNIMYFRPDSTYTVII